VQVALVRLHFQSIIWNERGYIVLLKDVAPLDSVNIILFQLSASQPFFNWYSVKHIFWPNVRDISDYE